MIIIGAKGLAKQILQVIDQLELIEYLTFYDDINKNGPDHLYKKFPILKTEDETKSMFQLPKPIRNSLKP